MKFVAITSYATPANMRRELLASAIACGHQVTLIAPEPEALMIPAMNAIGGDYVRWEVERAGLSPLRDLDAARRLLAILRQRQPDVVLLYQIKAVLLGPLLAKLARTPHVVALVNGLGAVFDTTGFGATWKARVARRAYSLSLRFVDRVVFQNPDDPALLEQLGILSKTALRTIVPGSGVDVTKFVPAPPSSDVVFTLVSRILVSKGIRDFARAAQSVRSKYPKTRFRLVGQLESATHPDAIRNDEIERWVEEGLIDYLGFTDDIRSVLASSTVFVLPSYYREGIPRTNLEALAMGLPIITTDSVGCRETVVDGANGFLVLPKDASMLAERMSRYVDDPALAVRHGAASRALAEQRFDVRHVNELMLDALQLRAGVIAS